jgi:alkaline phosphatase D
MDDAFHTLEQALAGPMDRRRFLIFSGALAGAAAFCQLRGDLAQAGPPLRDYPFTLGVASGDPAPSRAVLWTRLAPDIYEPDGGMPHRRVPVKWRVAKDPGMRRVVRQGVALAVPELAHSVHVELSGLDPGREYFFQFKYRDELSPMGRTCPAPANGASVRSLAFAFASCQRWDEGYYSAYRRMAEEDIRVRSPSRRLPLRVRDRRERRLPQHPGARPVPPRRRRSSATGSSTASTRATPTCSAPISCSRG